MCNPLLIGVALVAAGTAAQQKSQSDRLKAQRKAAQETRFAESQRQEQMREERFKELTGAETNATLENQQAQLDAAAAKREAAYASATELPGDTGYQSQAASAMPRVVQAENDKQRAAADEEVNTLGQARAKLNAFGDLNLGNRILNSNTANRLDMLGGFARGSAQLLPGEVQAAIDSKAGVGRTLGTIGNVATIVGGALMGGAGAAGAGGGAAAGGAGAAGAGAAGASAGAAGAAGSAAAAGSTSLFGGMFSNPAFWGRAAGSLGTGLSGTYSNRN